MKISGNFSKMLFRNFMIRSVLVGLLSCSLSHARLSDETTLAALNNPVYQLNPNYPELHLVLGAIGIKCRIWYSYRFFGPFEEAYNETTYVREYIEDKVDHTNDPLWQFVKHFFVSPSGSDLNPSLGDVPQYIGSLASADDPKTGAEVTTLLLAYAHKLRGGAIHLPETSFMESPSPCDVSQISEKGKKEQKKSCFTLLDVLSHFENSPKIAEELLEALEKVLEFHKQMALFHATFPQGLSHFQETLTSLNPNKEKKNPTPEEKKEISQKSKAFDNLNKELRIILDLANPAHKTLNDLYLSLKKAKPAQSKGETASIKDKIQSLMISVLEKKVEITLDQIVERKKGKRLEKKAELQQDLDALNTQPDTPKKAQSRTRLEASLASLEADMKDEGNFKKKIKDSYLTAIPSYVKSLLTWIEGSLKKEGTDYPRYATEQVVLSFFYEMYSTKEDVEIFMAHMKASIPEAFAQGTHTTPSSSSSSSSSTTPEAKNKDLFKLVKEYLEISLEQEKEAIIPYENSVSLVQNKSTRIYDRAKNAEIKDTIFQDCVEASLLHIMNLTLYYDGKFNPGAWIAALSDANQKKNIEEFYKDMKAADANKGETNFRSRWNRIVGDLNKLNPLQKVRYSEAREGAQFNMYPGFINLVHAQAAMTQTPLDHTDSISLTDSEAKIQEWIKKHLTAILTNVGKPGRTYKMDFLKFEKTSDDVHGELKVTVIEKEGNKDLYHYTIESKVGHGLVKNVFGPQSQKERLRNMSIAYTALYSATEKFDAFMPLFSKSSFRDASHLEKMTTWQRLFHNSFEDDAARGNVIEKIAFSKANKDIDHFTSLEKSLFQHILLKTSWDDYASVEFVIKVLNKLHNWGSFLGITLNRNQGLTWINLGHNNLGVEGGKSIAEILKNNHTLTSMDMTFHGVGAEGAKAIAEALKINKTLTSIELSHNRMGSEGGKGIAEALKINKTLTSIGLNNNSLGVEGGKAISDALKNNNTLTSIDLSFNPLDAEGVKAIAEALKINKTLTSIILYGTMLSEGNKAIAESLKTNKTLTSIGLSYNDLAAVDWKVLAEALETNKTLTSINLKRTNISQEAKNILSKIASERANLKIEY